MLTFLSLLCGLYPLLVSIPKGHRIETPSGLSVPGTLPDNLIIFIVDQFKFNQIKTIQQLKKWGNCYRFLDENGRISQFPSVDSNIYNFLDQMRELYPKKMNIDASSECLCKMDLYTGGLVTIHVIDADSHVIPEILKKVHEETALAFIASTEELFRY